MGIEGLRTGEIAREVKTGGAIVRRVGYIESISPKRSVGLFW
jgi:hypothetical protein